MNSISISKSIFIALFIIGVSTSSCKTGKKKQTIPSEKVHSNEGAFFKLSLAQWSLHRYVEEKKNSPFHFASQAKEMGFEGLEYVSQLYKYEIEKLGFDVVLIR